MPTLVNRSLVSVGYEVVESRGRTRTSRRCIDLDFSTVQVLRDWRDRRAAERLNSQGLHRDAYVLARPDGTPTHPQLISDAFRRLVKGSGLPRIRLHDYADVGTIRVMPTHLWEPLQGWDKRACDVGKIRGLRKASSEPTASASSRFASTRSGGRTSALDALSAAMRS